MMVFIHLSDGIYLTLMVFISHRDDIYLPVVTIAMQFITLRC